MRLADLVACLDTLARTGSLDVEVTHVTRDSRQVRPGSVFVAVPGARFDGHDAVGAMADAAAVVVQRPVEAPAGVAVIAVADTRRALGPLAAALLGNPSARVPVVGVTGTNGKTSVTTLVAQALQALGRLHGRIGTTGVEIAGRTLPAGLTTPEAPALQEWFREAADAGCAAVAMEVSSIGLDLGRVDGTRFHTTVFTNLGHDHLDFHGTVEAYAAAKAQLFEANRLRPAGGPPRAVLYADDGAWTQMAPPADRWLYGTAVEADLRLVGLQTDPAGMRLVLHTPDGVMQLRTPMVGQHNALNLAAAFGILRTLDISAADAVEALAQAPGAPGRMEVVPNGRGVLVLVDYAHTPDALAAVLETARGVTSGSLTVVFGCGGDRDAAKRPEMGRVALSADRVVVTSDNPRSEDPESIVHDILAGMGGANPHVEVDRRRAIAWALERAVVGDTVLIAGKGHETTQTIGDEVRPFDDRAVAAAVLEA